MNEAVAAGYDIVAARDNYTIPAMSRRSSSSAPASSAPARAMATRCSAGVTNTLVGLGGDDLYYVGDPSTR